MNTALKYYFLLEKSTSEFASLIKELFEQFPLAITELLRNAYEAGINSIDQLFANPQENKHVTLLTNFFKEGLIAVDTETICTGNFAALKQKIEHAARFVQAKIDAKIEKYLYGGPRPFKTIPNSEFEAVRNFM